MIADFSRGIQVSSGSILWNAMTFGSVSKYLEELAAKSEWDSRIFG